MVIGIDIAQQRRREIHIVDDNIDPAIIEEVAKGCTARRNDKGKTRSFDRWHQVKVLALLVVKQQGAFGVGGTPVVLVDHGINVAVDEKQIFPAVVVVVEE